MSVTVPSIFLAITAICAKLILWLCKRRRITESTLGDIEMTSIEPSDPTEQESESEETELKQRHISYASSLNDYEPETHRARPFRLFMSRTHAMAQTSPPVRPPPPKLAGLPSLAIKTAASHDHQRHSTPLRESHPLSMHSMSEGTLS